MAVVLILGRPGAGKSYTAIEEYVLPAHKAGRRVVHNISGLTIGDSYVISPVFPRASLEIVTIDGKKSGDICFNLESGFSLGCDGDGILGGDLVVIDEYHLVKNTFQPSARTGKNEWLFNLEIFLRAHRHYTDGKNTVDVVIMTQTDVDITDGIKQLAERTIICKPSIFGSNKLRRLYFDGFKAVRLATGASAIKQNHYVPKASIYKYYRSFTAGLAAHETNKGFGLLYLYRQVIISAIFFFSALIGLYLITTDQLDLFGNKKVVKDVVLVKPGDRGAGFGWRCGIGFNGKCAWWYRYNKK